MLYSEHRDSIQSGDLLAWSHHGWALWYDFQIQVVRMFTRSEYAHVGIAWRTSGRLFVIEAVTPRVQIFPLSLCENFYHLSMGKELTWDAEEFALSQVGEPYSKWMCLKAAFHNLRKGDLGEWQCAKLANEILRVNGFDFGETYEPTSLVQAVLDTGKSLAYIRMKDDK